jgi:hypothetical protein
MAGSPTYSKTEGKRLRKDRVIKKFAGQAEGASQQAKREALDTKRQSLLKKMRRVEGT